MKELVGLRDAVGQCPGEIVDGKCVATEEQLKTQQILEGFYKSYLSGMSKLRHLNCMATLYNFVTTSNKEKFRTYTTISRSPSGLCPPPGYC